MREAATTGPEPRRRVLRWTDCWSQWRSSPGTGGDRTQTLVRRDGPRRGNRINGREALFSRAAAVDPAVRPLGRPRHVGRQPRPFVREGGHLQGRLGDQRGPGQVRQDRRQGPADRADPQQRQAAAGVLGRRPGTPVAAAAAEAGRRGQAARRLQRRRAEAERLHEPAVQPAAHRGHRADLPVHHEPDAGRRLAGDELRQVQGQAHHQGHPEDHLRRRGRGRRGPGGA